MGLYLKHLLVLPGYNGAKLLDTVKARLSLKNDAQLSRALNVEPPVISKIRTAASAPSPYLMLRITELTGMTYPEIRQITGEPDWRASSDNNRN